MFRPFAIARHLALLCLCCNLFLSNLSSCCGQDGAAKDSKVTRDENGLYTLVSQRLTLVSDIPLDDELMSWPGLLEQSLEQWQAYFAVDAVRMANWKIKAILIGNREKMTQLGLLKGVPPFDEGYQFNDTVFLREQPTVYFRRLLFLHEATHWIVWKLYGGGGAPWFMEGMAEMQGTHDIVDGRLKLGVIPLAPERVAGWGRLRVIDETLNSGEAPTMAEIFAFGNARENHVRRYSWSWAACVFFTNHPKYGPMLRELYRDGLDYSSALSIKFRKRLEPEWGEVLLEWNAFVSDLDFGYDIARSALDGGQRKSISKGSDSLPLQMNLAADRGWQSTGVLVQPGKPIRISCTGNYQLKGSTLGAESVWIVEPCGITYQYYRGNPLGCVIASVVPDELAQKTERWQTVRVGNGTTVNSQLGGRLFLKVNEPSRGLKDNEGAISVEVLADNSR